MESLSPSERAWIWTARVIGGAMFVYAAVVLRFEIPTPAYIVIGGLLGGEHAYKASRKAEA